MMLASKKSAMLTRGVILAMVLLGFFSVVFMFSPAFAVFVKSGNITLTPYGFSINALIGNFTNLRVHGSASVIEGNLSMNNNTIKEYFGFPRPDYDSGWVAVSQGEFKIYEHNLGGDINDYFIGAMANDSSAGGTGLNNLHFGLNKEGVTNIRRGFYWFNLNTTTLTVYRGTHDIRAPNIKIRIWRISRDDDSTELVGAGNNSDPLRDERAFIFSHTNVTIPVIVVGRWYNITFDKNEDVGYGITHNSNDATNDTFTIQQNGTYDIHGHFSIQDSDSSPVSNIVFRFLKNGEEVHGSVRERDLDKKDWDALGSVTVFANLVEGDKIKFQFTADVTTVSLMTGSTYGEHYDSAVMKIKRIA